MRKRARVKRSPRRRRYGGQGGERALDEESRREGRHASLGGREGVGVETTT